MLILSGIFILACVVALYFVPAIVASRRQHKQHRAIFWLNLLLGFTYVGWVAALVWALIEE